MRGIHVLVHRTVACEELNLENRRRIVVADSTRSAPSLGPGSLQERDRCLQRGFGSASEQASVQRAGAGVLGERAWPSVLAACTRKREQGERRCLSIAGAAEESRCFSAAAAAAAAAHCRRFHPPPPAGTMPPRPTHDGSDHSYRMVIEDRECLCPAAGCGPVQLLPVSGGV